MVRTRQEPPKDPSEYIDFPAVSLGAGVSVFRSHGIGDDPYQVSSYGRFGLKGVFGTFYVGDNYTVAIRERIGANLGVIPLSLTAGFEVSELVTLRTWRCADVLHPTAADFGVTRAPQPSDPINTADPNRKYDQYQVELQFAQCFLKAGLQGIRYGSNFAPSYSPNAWALFIERKSNRSMKTIRTVSGVAAVLAAGLSLEPRTRNLSDFTVWSSWDEFGKS